jgi:hypothetical protein
MRSRLKLAAALATTMAACIPILGIDQEAQLVEDAGAGQDSGRGGGGGGGTGGGGGPEGGGGGGGGGVAEAAGVPVHAPTSVTFRDEDPTEGNVSGTVKIGRASDESDVSTYNLYWGSSATAKLASITSLPKTGADLAYLLVGRVQPGATDLLAFTANEYGEMPTGVSVASIDNFPVFTNIAASAGLTGKNGWATGYTPRVIVDDVNSKLLIATTNGGNYWRPALFRCNLDGTSCVYADISAGQPGGTGYSPSLVIDRINNKLLVVTAAHSDTPNNGEPALFRCNLDGTGCSYVDISAGRPPGSGHTVSALVDALNGKLLVVTEDVSGNNPPKPALFRCSLDGTGCAYVDISAGRPLGSGGTPAAVIDTVTPALLVVTNDGSNNGKPALFRCALDGTGCSYTDLSAGRPAQCGGSPSVVIDSVSSYHDMYLLVVTSDGSNNGKPALFRCNMDGSNCHYTDISAGQPNNIGMTPSAVVDTVNAKLLVVTWDPSLFRCNLDGTGCAYVEISAGHWGGYNPSAAIDATSGRLLAVTDDDNDNDVVALYTLGLW